MKKYLKLLLLVPLLVAMLITGFSTQVRADDDPDYSITNVNVTAKVNRDGSLSMERRVTYDFDSEANGVYSKQNLGEGMKLKDPEVELYDFDNHKTRKITRNANKKDNYYQLKKQGNDYRFKVFHHIDYDHFTIIYRFKITNAITNWNDVAELNYKIIGNDWGVDLDHVKAEVVFQNSVKNLKAWAHGPLTGHVQVLPKQGKIIMMADDVPGDGGIEVHTIFPTSVTDMNSNVKKADRRAAVMKQEAEFANQANRKRHLHRLEGIVPFFIALTLNVIAIILLLIQLVKSKKPKRLSQLSHNYEIPSVNPAIAQILDKGKKPDGKAVVAELLWQIGHKLITITKSENGGYDLKAKSVGSLNSGLMTYLFTRLDKKRKLTFNTNSLKMRKSNQLYYVFSSWQRSVVEDAYRAKFFDRKKSNDNTDPQLAKWIYYGSIVAYLAAIWFLYQAMTDAYREYLARFLSCAIALLIVESVTFFILKKLLARHYLSYTEKGLEQANKIRSFKKMLNDIGRFKMKDVGDIVLWEDILPYAAAFGLAEKVLKQMKLEFPKEELERLTFYQTDFDDQDYLYFEDDFDHRFNRVISAGELATTTSNWLSSSDSSSSGGSGGFSGGDSGGFGGGSGDGAF